MRVLLSAYACEPGKGSEPEVGWRWAIELARLGHDVTVLTRANNRPAIEARAPAGNPTFAYFDLPRWLGFWKHGRRGIHLYYLLWQWRALRVARRLHDARPFDRVHHVTFVAVRQPSFLGRLGVPFVFGPVSGGETAPWRLRGGRGAGAFLAEFVRDAANLAVRVDPLMAATFRAAERIVVTSAATAALIPARFRAKTTVALAIGIDAADWPATVRTARGTGLRLLFVGQLTRFKALDLALEALAQARRAVPDSRLTVIGAGPMERRWRARAAALGLDDAVDWRAWIARAELPAAYADHDVLMFPSLRDSGGLVVLEALATGMPAVVLDLAGPGVVADESCAIKVAATARGRAAVVADLADAIVRLAREPGLLERLSLGAPARAREFGFGALVRRLYDPAVPPTPDARSR